MQRVQQPSLRDQQKQLQADLKNIRREQEKVRAFLKAKEDQARQRQAAKDLSIDSSAPVQEADIANLEKDLQELSTSDNQPKLPNFRAQSLPHSIEARLENGSVPVLVETGKNWGGILQQLQEKGGFSGLPVQDIQKLVVQIPVAQRGYLVSTLEKMVDDARIVPTQFLRDGLMGGYAQIGAVDDVERLLSACAAPTVHSYGHIAKAYFKTKNLYEVTNVLNRLEEKGISPTLPIYTTVLQACIQHRDYQQALDIFDNLKYISAETQPDTKMYNSMILAAAKQHNVNKALDLYEEMQSRPDGALQPNPETYNLLVYACSREERMHLKAWHFFVEMMDRGLAVGRESVNALLYLCGSTGELLLSRALFQQLCRRPETYPDSFAVTCLFNAYARHTGEVSKVLASPMGAKIRSKVLLDVNSLAGPNMPPMLPLTMLSPQLVLAESEAILKYFAEHRPDLLQVNSRASMSDASARPAVFSYLKLASEIGDMQEYKRRYEELTYPNASAVLPAVEILSEETVPSTTKSSLAHVSLERGIDVYRQGLLAAIKFRDMEFARQVWVERGAWRRTNAFKKLPKKIRDQSDVRFARDMVELLGNCGEIDEAIQLVKSTAKMFRWRRVHLEPLLAVCAEHEDFDSINTIRSILRQYYTREQSLLNSLEK